MRDTRPLRPLVRDVVVRLMALSPEGRTITELRAFLVTQRPASRDTIARVLDELVRDGLLAVSAEPTWRRLVRQRLALVPNAPRSRRGRHHLLFTPTRALHAHVHDHPFPPPPPAVEDVA